MNQPGSRGSVHPLRVCVLLGGDTGERDVSLHSGMSVASALLHRGHAACLLDPATGKTDRLDGSRSEAPDDSLLTAYRALRPKPRTILQSLARLDPADVDVVAIALHGGAGEDGRIQAILDLAGIPYVGSGPAASAVAMDKVLAKRVMGAEGIPLARQILWGAGWTGEATPPPPGDHELAEIGGYPVVVKPISGGSTIGITIVRAAGDWGEAWAAAVGQVDPERGLMVEEYIAGRELTVGVLDRAILELSSSEIETIRGAQALPIVEIVPKSGFYDYRRKYTAGETEYVAPARLPAEVAERLARLGLAAYETLGCRDMGRVDFRLSPEGRVACLEVNTVPGMTATSLLPKAAATSGIGFDDLVDRLCRRAWSRRGPEPATCGEK